MKHAPKSLLYRENAAVYLENFFLSSILTILVTRLYLHVMHFPRIEAYGVHIAHMLWGGLLMLVAQILLFSLKGERVIRLSSVIGGIGFGLFIDELGKFITSNNNYFFEPTFAILYVIFIIFFLVIRFFAKKTEHLTEKESPVLQVRDYLVKLPYFTHIVIAFFIGLSLFNLSKSITFLATPHRLNNLIIFSDIGQFISTLIASLMALVGITIFWKYRLLGYRFFRLSLLTSIFLTEFFDFYNHQLEAVFLLVFYLLTLQVTNALSEKRKKIMFKYQVPSNF